MILAPIGMTCLGIVMCYLGMYFVARLKEHTTAGLTAVVGVLLGGVVAKFLTDNTTAGADSIWWYPIGLLAGLAIWTLMRVTMFKPRRTDAPGVEAKRPQLADSATADKKVRTGTRSTSKRADSSVEPLGTRSKHTVSAPIQPQQASQFDWRVASGWAITEQPEFRIAVSPKATRSPESTTDEARSQLYGSALDSPTP